MNITLAYERGQGSIRLDYPIAMVSIACDCIGHQSVIAMRFPT